MARAKRLIWGLTVNEVATLLLSLASVIIAGITLWLSLVSTETTKAVNNLAALAQQARRQSETLVEQVRVLNRQANEQHRQSGYLSEQAKSASSSALIAQEQLATSQRALAESNRRSSAQTMYQMRLEAMGTWIRGQAAFSQAIQEIRSRQTADIEEISEVNGLTRQQMEQVRDIVDQIIAAQHTFDAAYQSTVAAWPKTLRSLMADTLNHANKLADCYEQAAIRPLSDEEASRMRSYINAKCRNLGRESALFRQASKAVFEVMANEVYRAALRAGANPEEATIKLKDTWSEDSQQAHQPH